MNDNLVALKAAIAAFFTALGTFLGWQGVMMLIWVIAMGLDWLSGTLPAWLSGQWDSAIAREGAKHKAGMIFAVAVAGITDITLVIICDHLPLGMEWPVLVLPMVLAWYILTELGSILENAVKMGAPMPEWLLKILRAGLKILDAAVDSAVTIEAAGIDELNTDQSGSQ